MLAPWHRLMVIVIIVLAVRHMLHYLQALGKNQRKRASLPSMPGSCSTFSANPKIKVVHMKTLVSHLEIDIYDWPGYQLICWLHMWFMTFPARTHPLHQRRCTRQHTGIMTPFDRQRVRRAVPGASHLSSWQAKSLPLYKLRQKRFAVHLSRKEWNIAWKKYSRN